MPTVEQFTDHPRVKASLAALKKTFDPVTGKPFVVSDVADPAGHQYVNLVQKGGGVLGIALVGYTYILEEMGVRFLRLAGTSAGAINTGLMTVIDKKEDAKSRKVLADISALDFFKLVDGHPAAKKIIKSFITQKNFTSRIRKQLLFFALTLGGFTVLDGLLLGLRTHFPKLFLLGVLSFIITGLLLLIVVVLFTYLQLLLSRLKDSGFGINPGDYFYDWIKARLIAYGVHNVTDLTAKASADIPGLYLLHPEQHPEGKDDLVGDVTFIASELVTQNKIELPRMCHLFRVGDDIEKMQPAGFIRASMAIPVFFESYYINEIPCTNTAIKDAWAEFNVDDPPSTVRFVDGGLLSNFPVDIFYKPDIAIPRLPVFGIDLDDSDPADNSKHAMGWSLGGYFGRLLNTVRSNYDKEFLLKNKMFQKGIGKVTIPPDKFNWLNFFMKDEEMIELFCIGAEAATAFLLQFDWEDYKKDRVKYYKQL